MSFSFEFVASVPDAKKIVEQEYAPHEVKLFIYSKRCAGVGSRGGSTLRRLGISTTATIRPARRLSALHRGKTGNQPHDLRPHHHSPALC